MPKSTRQRNRPCPCGSGKSFKKCCRDKKPRSDRAIAVSRPIGETFPNGKIPAGRWTISTTPEGVKIDVSGKEIAMIPGFQLQSAYERKGKGDKVLRQVPVASLFDNRELLDPGAIHRHCTTFDRIFVIDTNTKLIDGTNRSAAVSLVCRAVMDESSAKEHSDRARMLFHHNPFGVFRYQGLSPGEAEKRALVELVDSILKHSAYKPSQQIAIVTDHDLGSHVAINARETPLWGGALLPPNFALLYASADGGKENALNRAMALCDARATEVLGWPLPLVP